MAEENASEKTKSGFDFKIILAGFLVFVVCMVAAYFVFKSLMAPLLPHAEEQEVQVSVGSLVPVGEFTTNVNDVAGTRFIRVEVTVESSLEEGAEVVNENMPVIKDSIITILSSQTVADLDIRNRENLKQKIKEDLNSRLGAEVISNVYFTKFMMQ